jgi:uncharacterized protein
VAAGSVACCAALCYPPNICTPNADCLRHITVEVRRFRRRQRACSGVWVMNIAVIGATGKAGSRVVNELLARGHHVTAIVRHPELLPAHPSLTARYGDARIRDDLARLLADHDAVVTATRLLQIDPDVLVAAVKRSEVKRLMVVGGAGTLKNASGVELIDAGLVPITSLDEALSGRRFLTLLQKEREFDWTYLSPSLHFAPGKRTGKFRLGEDEVLVGVDGRSAISMEDYAIAVVDELERPQHRRRRFTVGY